MLFTFLLVIHALIAASLVGVILMQRSEGGGLGMGGSPTGLMSARGAADFLTRTTTILAAIFVVMSIGLAALASVQNRPRTIDSSLARTPAPAGAAIPPVAPVPGAAPGAVPFEGDPLSGAAAAIPGAAPAATAVPTLAPTAEPKAAPARREASGTTGAPNGTLTTPARSERTAPTPRTERSTPAPTPRSTAPAAEPKAESAPAPSAPAITPPGVATPTTGNSATPQ